MTVNSTDEDTWNTTSEFFISFGAWFLALMNFVPISLLVTLEMCKYLQGVFIGWDILMYDREKDMPARCNSSNLNEQLGMIHYIFSDKTGTLTTGRMKLKKILIG